MDLKLKTIILIQNFMMIIVSLIDRDTNTTYIVYGKKSTASSNAIKILMVKSSKKEFQPKKKRERSICMHSAHRTSHRIEYYIAKNVCSCFCLLAYFTHMHFNAFKKHTNREKKNICGHRSVAFCKQML